MYLSGHKLRTETEKRATIIDLDAERATFIDNDKKTFTTMTFAELADAMQRSARSAADAQARATQQGSRAGGDPNAPKGDVSFTYTVAVDPTGQHEKVAGYDAERTFVTITIAGTAKPEGGQTQQAGSIVFLTENWMSKDAPQIAAMQEFQRMYAEKVGQVFRPGTESISAAFAFDPRIKVGFEAASKELQKVQGLSLRSMTYVTLVPADMTFDRNLALGDAASDSAKKATEKPSGGFGSLINRMKAAAQANQSGQTAQQSAPPKQATLMTMRDDVRSIVLGPVAPDLFAPPGGYREIKPSK